MDIKHYFSGDIYLSGTGDFSTVKDLTESQQRILRRLLTNPGDYIWHPDYGAGVGKYVGATSAALAKLKGVIKSQVLLERSVAADPAPVITFKSDYTALTCTIQYTDADTQGTQSLSFTVSN